MEQGEEPCPIRAPLPPDFMIAMLEALEEMIDPSSRVAYFLRLALIEAWET